MASVTPKSYEQLPVDDLGKIGISKEMLEKMPVQFVDSLKRGEITPLVQTSVTASNGKTVTLPLRLQVVSDAATGDVKLLAYPTRKEVDNSLGLSRYEIDKVTEGEAITKELMQDGKRDMHMIQFDGRTNSLVHMPVKDLRLDERIKELESIHDIQLGTQQKEQIRTGKPVELSVGDEKVTVGVDLREPHAFKVIKGDMDEWKRREMERYDIAHPEVMGFVQTDRNRWEYKQVVDRDHGIGQNQSIGQEHSKGMKI